jgi:hypothetical protein
MKKAARAAFFVPDRRLDPGLRRDDDTEAAATAKKRRP